MRTARTAPDDDVIRRFDAKSKVLFLHPYSPAAARTFQTAFQIATLEAEEKVTEIASGAEFRSPEGFEICKIGLYNYFAGALLLPLRAVSFRSSGTAPRCRGFGHAIWCQPRAGRPPPFNTAASGTKGGASVLRAHRPRRQHHQASQRRQVAIRSLWLRARLLWNIHQAFEAPGRILRQLAETPDRVRYLCIATEISKRDGGFHAAHRRYAIALGCELSYANDFVYADGLEFNNRVAFDPIGISCRICDRTNCSQRAVPPIKRRLHIDQNRRGALPYRLE